MATESFATEAGHWYRPDGSAMYTITGKNGKERATTLRDARELGLVPSVTSILKLEAKPQLTNWLVQQGMLACLTLPRLEDEDTDAFMARALKDSQEQASKARERGTAIHGYIERAIGSDPLDDVDGFDRDIVDHVLQWLSVNFHGYQWSPERSFACQYGFGGKLDAFGECGEEAVILDWKVKVDIVEGKQLGYPEHATQLAAYAMGLGKPKSRAINLFVSSTVPGLIVAKEWTATELTVGWEVFSHLLAIWKLRRGL